MIVDRVTRPFSVGVFLTSVGVLLAALAASAQTQTDPSRLPPSLAEPAPQRAGLAITAPVDYVIGPEDVLGVVFWREPDLSGDVIVRPDGKISLPLLNDVQAAGLTPDALREQLNDAASRYIENPSATVVVRAINSRKVFITGLVAKPGTYALTAPTTVVQLIAMAGGLQEYADDKNIVILRTERGYAVSYRLNFRDVARRINVRQNIELMPGDTVIVP
jgi:polysaccharide export outer membrane protein